jgi:hypothetical protein
MPLALVDPLGQQGGLAGAGRAQIWVIRRSIPALKRDQVRPIDQPLRRTGESSETSMKRGQSWDPFVAASNRSRHRTTGAQGRFSPAAENRASGFSGFLSRLSGRSLIWKRPSRPDPQSMMSARPTRRPGL